MPQLRLFQVRLSLNLPRFLAIDRGRYRRYAPRVGIGFAVLFLMHLGLWFWLATWARGRVEGYIAGNPQILEARQVGIGGYPLHIEARLTDVVFHSVDALPGTTGTSPLVSVRLGVLALRGYTIIAPRGISFEVPGLHVSAEHARVQLVGLRDDAPRNLEVDLGGISFGAEASLATADSLDLQVSVASAAPQTDTEVAADFAFQISNTRVRGNFGELGSKIRDIHCSGTVNGRIPARNGRAALIAWRDGGGTIELRQVGLDWGELSIAGGGTMALDKDLQPQMALSATVRGWGSLIDGLGASGAMKPEEARIIRFGLSLISPPGAEHSLRIPITIQDRELYLEKAKIAHLPEIDWQS